MIYEASVAMRFIFLQTSQRLAGGRSRCPSLELSARKFRSLSIRASLRNSIKYNQCANKCRPRRKNMSMRSCAAQNTAPAAGALSPLISAGRVSVSLNFPRPMMALIGSESFVSLKSPRTISFAFGICFEMVVNDAAQNFCLAETLLGLVCVGRGELRFQMSGDERESKICRDLNFHFRKSALDAKTFSVQKKFVVRVRMPRDDGKFAQHSDVDVRVRAADVFPKRKIAAFIF